MRRKYDPNIIKEVGYSEDNTGFGRLINTLFPGKFGSEMQQRWDRATPAARRGLVKLTAGVLAGVGAAVGVGAVAETFDEMRFSDRVEHAATMFCVDPTELEDVPENMPSDGRGLSGLASDVLTEVSEYGRDVYNVDAHQNPAVVLEFTDVLSEVLRTRDIQAGRPLKDLGEVCVQQLVEYDGDIRYGFEVSATAEG